MEFIHTPKERWLKGVSCKSTFTLSEPVVRASVQARTSNIQFWKPCGVKEWLSNKIGDG